MIPTPDLEEQISASQDKALKLAFKLARENWLFSPPVGDFEDTLLLERDEQILQALNYDGAPLTIEDFNPRLYEHVQDRQEANDLSDQLCHALNMWAEAGYLYGLAFGLTLGRGGAR